MPHCRALGIPRRGWGPKTRSRREVSDTRRKWPTESTKQRSYVLTDTEAAGMRPTGIGTRSSVCMRWLGAFVGPLTAGDGVSLTRSPLGILSLLLGGCVQPRSKSFFCLVSLYPALPRLVVS